ncbi:MAG: PhzF family phenazine biosynthesis protein [Planctomycetes bacterium]|nr:PhzF family phenazine biosynthesis protein [Planctomycetota bacterium]
MTNHLYLVDAFAEQPFQGNPAAVCVVGECPKDPQDLERWYQKVAAEMNQAETAFLMPAPDGWALRWFTPVNEIDLCGHATMASAHILWETERAKPESAITFTTKSGKLICRQTPLGISMDFPSEPVVERDAPDGLIAGLGSQPLYVGKNRFDYFVLLDSEETVRRLQPDMAELSKVPTRGIIVTAKATGGFDFVSRAFFPLEGVPEDHVCGSAHCGLGPFWRERLKTDEMVAFQASPQRGGIVHVRCAGERVFLSGRAVTTLRGELLA